MVGPEDSLKAEFWSGFDAAVRRSIPEKEKGRRAPFLARQL
jgi:hypothetical protein